MRHKRRYPIRDPLAGILSDWFGLDAGSSKILLVLHRADGALSAHEIARKADVAQTSVCTLCASLRAAGIDLPRGNRWVKDYELTDKGRAQVAAAFSETMMALELAGEVSRTRMPRTSAEPIEDRFLNLLRKEGFVTTHKAMSTLYAQAAFRPHDKILRVYASRIRHRLEPGERIKAVRGEGYRLHTSH